MFRTGPRRFGQRNKQAIERAASTANRVPPSSREEETALCNHVPHCTPTRSDDIKPDRLTSVGGTLHASEFNLDTSHYTNSPITGAAAAVNPDDPAACVARPRCSTACSHGDGAYSRILPARERASFSSLRGSKHLSGDYGLAEVSAWIHSQLPDNLSDQDLDKTVPQETSAPPLILDANLSRTNGAAWSEQDLSAETCTRSGDQPRQKWSTKVSDQSTDYAGTGSCFSGSQESIPIRTQNSRQASIDTEGNTDTSSVLERNSLSSFSHDLKKPYVFIETSILDTPHLRVNRNMDSVKNSKYTIDVNDHDYLNIPTVNSNQNSNVNKTELDLPRNIVNGVSHLSDVDGELSLPYINGELNNNHNTPKIDNLNNNASPSSDITSKNRPPPLHDIRVDLAFSDFNGFPPPPELKDFNTPEEDHETSPLLNAFPNPTPKLDDQTWSAAPMPINSNLKTIDIPDKLKRLSDAINASDDMSVKECHSLLDHHDNPIVTSSCIT